MSINDLENIHILCPRSHTSRNILFPLLLLFTISFHYWAHSMRQTPLMYYTLPDLILTRTLYNAYFIFILHIKILWFREIHHWAKILLQNNDSIYFKNIEEHIIEKLEECILKGEEKFSLQDGIMKT